MKLEITLNYLNGLARRPVARTNSPLLEVSNTYQWYNKLVKKFSSIFFREKFMDVRYCLGSEHIPVERKW